MKAIESLESSEASRLRGLLFDLDDTFLDGGTLTESAYRALFELHSAGLHLVVATGRPAAWGALLARMWPVVGVVSENGAIFHYRDDAGRLVMDDPLTMEQRRQQQARLLEAIGRLRSLHPELAVADDAAGRISDFTFDIGETCHVAPQLVAGAVRSAEELGLRTLRSSVHLHVTLDQSDKATGCLRFLNRRLGRDPTRARWSFAFIGDSGNDGPCFGAFQTSIGVANLSGRSTLVPRFLTRAAKSAGFVEAARLLIARRAKL